MSPAVLLVQARILMLGAAIASCASCREASPSAQTSRDSGDYSRFAEADIIRLDPVPELGRIGGLAWLDASRLAVVDEFARQVLVFDRRGGLLERLGREGDGPGEFRNITGVGTMSGDLLVFESAPGPSRVHRRSTSGVWSRRELRDQIGRLRAIGSLSNGELLVTCDGFVAVTPQVAGSVWRDSLRVGVMSSAGVVEWLTTRAGRSWLSYSSQLQSGRVLMTSASIGASSAAVPADDAVWICDSSDGSCSVHEFPSRKVRSIVLELPSLRVDDGIVEAMRTAALDAAPNEFVRERVTAQFAPNALPAELPRFAEVFGDATEGIWVQSLGPAASERRLQHLDSLGRRGRLFVVPSRLAVRAIGEFGIAGVIVDADGRETAAILPWPRASRN